MQYETKLMPLLSLLGLGISVYLYWHSLFSYQSLACPIGGSGCTDVNQSPFATIWGIPVALFGVLGYILFLVLSIVRLRYTIKSIERIFFVCLGGALLFSIYLMSISLFVIQEICIWCVLSAFLILFLFLLQWSNVK